MDVYRCYTDTPEGWREWGIDFPTLSAARDALASFKHAWPRHRFMIRRATRDGRVGDGR